MIPLNVSFGIYAFMPQGWLFMLAIILLECSLLSYLLHQRLFDLPIYGAVFLSNAVSGILGIIGSVMLTGGWWMVVWFPWVSSNEVRGVEAFKVLAIFYLIAFVLTLVIEGLINTWSLKKYYPQETILSRTFVVNFISYLLGSIVLYGFSF